jgi:hypothetical protein
MTVTLADGCILVRRLVGTATACQGPKTPHEMQQDLLALHRRFPILLWKARGKGHIDNHALLPPELPPCIKPRGKRLAVMVPTCFETIVYLYEGHYHLAFMTAGCTQGLLPAHGSRYFKALGEQESEWLAVVNNLRTKWSPYMIGDALQRRQRRFGEGDAPRKPMAPDDAPAPKARRQRPPKDLLRLHPKTLGGHLELSTILGALNHPGYPNQSQVREVVNCLIAGNPQQAVRLFNRYFGDHTIDLRLRFFQLAEEFVILDNVPPTRLPTALQKLLLSPDSLRMKKCPECSKYFFDRTRRRNQKYCNARKRVRPWGGVLTYRVTAGTPPVVREA